MDAGYEPGRVIQLSRRTSEAIDSLAGLASADPAAADAIRTIRLTRRNLEDHWIPALRDIEGSDTMVRWRSSRLGTLGFRSRTALGDSLPDHLRPGGVTAVPISAKRRAQLLGQLDFLERKTRSGEAERKVGIDPTGGPTNAELRALGISLAWWVVRDQEFADELAELSTTNMLVGQLLGETRFPSSFAASVVKRMSQPNGPVTNVDRDRYAASLGTALASLTDDPGACLDLLMADDTTVLYTLGNWRLLDQDIVSEFVMAGLFDAVELEPGRLRDGYKVLTSLTAIANGSLDSGFQPGLALAAASSMAAYVDTFAPSLDKEGNEDVVIRDLGPRIILGTYSEVTDLIGALLRDEAAQSALGTVVGAYTVTAVVGAGEDLALVGAEGVVELGILVGHAARAERGELFLAAAAEEARRRQAAGLVGVAVGVIVKGPPARAIAGQAVKAAAAWLSRSTPDRIEETRLPARTYDLLTLTTVTMVTEHVDLRRTFGLGNIPARQWEELSERIEEIENEGDPDEWILLVGDLEHSIETSSPILYSFLQDVRTRSGAGELTRDPDAGTAD